jgi:hypothetical protein
MHSHIPISGFPKLFVHTKLEVALALLVLANLVEYDDKILCGLCLDVVLLEIRM